MPAPQRPASERPDRRRPWLTADWVRQALLLPRGAVIDLFLQPIVDARTGVLVACEGLSRMTDPTTRRQAPGTVLSVAASSGFLDDLTWQVIDFAAQDARVLRDHGLPVPVTLNVSPASMGTSTVVVQIMQALESHDVPPSSLIVEITELEQFDDLSGAQDVVRRLRREGIRIALDDFGAGFSTHERLRLLDVDIVKIDRGVVIDHSSRAHMALLNHLMEVTGQRGLCTIAEGIETDEQSATMTARGIDWLQGFAVAPAMPVGDLLGWVGSRGPSGTDL